METNYFQKLSDIQCEVEKKNWLNYISWSDAWAEVKKIHPDATYRKLVNELDNTFLFRSGTGGMVVCEVTINWIAHTADLAVTDFKNQEIKYESIKSTDIQNTTQRAFAKAIAMHWLWLYVYRGEDFPNEDSENQWNNAPISHDVPQVPSKTTKPYITSPIITFMIQDVKEGKLQVASVESLIEKAREKYIVARDWAEKEFREKYANLNK